MVHWTAAYDDGPTAVRYPRGAGDDRLPEGRTPIALVRAEVLGVNDPSSTLNAQRPMLAIVAIGSMVSVAWEASGKLA